MGGTTKIEQNSQLEISRIGFVNFDSSFVCVSVKKWCVSNIPSMSSHSILLFGYSMQNRVHEVMVAQVVLAVLTCDHKSFNVCEF